MARHRLAPAALIAGLVAAPGLPSLAAAAIGFPAGPYTVEADQAGFRIDGQYQLLRGGTLQYWRLPKEVWRDRLKRFKAAGFNTVDMYVPWNVVEPVEGQFNFSDPDMHGFLALCKELGLFVYLRPGPYITNEMDGGGVPAWLAARSTKKSLAADGKPNLRTQDPDYLDSVRKYLSRLNRELKPWLASRGGPIVLYSIENEYNWFEIFKLLDKAAWHEGGWERPYAEAPVTTAYLTALRDMVLADGIDVPITSCPGDGKLTGMGGVPGVIPMPNMYAGMGGSSPEKTAWSLLSTMHDPSRNGGIYANYPSGTTETDRLPAKLKRLFMGGLDATFAFNIAGSHQEGYRNGVALNIESIKSIINTQDKRSLAQKIAGIEVGYYSNVIDFNGAISPSGGNRENFHEFRRDNLTLDTLTPVLAPLTRPLRSSSTGAGSDARLSITNTALGAIEGKERWHYWWQSPQGTTLVGLVNQSTTEQVIGVNGLTVMGEKLPRYAPLTIPLQSFDGKPQFGESDLTYAQILVRDLPLPLTGRLHYTTSELLTARRFNDEQLLVVHGKNGTRGEIVLDNLSGLRVVSRDEGITIHEQSSGHLVASYPHEGVRQLLLADAAGRTVRVVITEWALAGRTWFVGQPGREALLIGPDFIDEDSLQDIAGATRLVIDHARAGQPISLIAPDGRTLDGLTATAANVATHHVRYAAPATTPLPALPDLWAQARTAPDLAEAAPGANTASGWQHWTGEPQALERKGINTGHAWYRATFQWNGPLTGDVPLRVQHASDFIGIYVNGHYVTTLAPMGTEIDSYLWNARYRFPSLAPWLKKGENVIAFRTEIWGHGSFMFPRGKIGILGPSAPALGFDSLKGLYGQASVGHVPLTRWSVREGLGGEQSGLSATGFDDSLWNNTAGPRLPLAKGEVRWIRTRFDTRDLPDPSALQAPVVLSLKGARSKATIWLNGRLIGRWISDNALFRQGFWASGTREMWMNTDPDHFPVAREALRNDGQPNVLAIAFEDTSAANAQPGSIDGLQLTWAVENRRFDAQGRMERIAATRWRVPVSLR